jgi:hypothetical protein
MRAILLLLSLSTLLPHSALSASCCGGGASFPSLITGDFWSQFNSSYAYSSVIGDADTGGRAIFRNKDNDEITQTMKVDGSYLIADYWQAGLSVPVVKREKKYYSSQSESTGLGDINAQVSYEFLPELLYSPWKPRGFVYAGITVPTAPSVYDFNDSLGADARGRGFYTFDVGISFLKTKGLWDYVAMASVSQSLNKQYSARSGERGMIYSSPGVMALVGLGYTPGSTSAWRLGGSLAPRYEGAKVVEGRTSTLTEYQLVWDSMLSLSYLFEKEMSFSAQYLDQTLVGPAHNTTLSRTISLNLQRRFSL